MMSMVRIQDYLILFQLDESFSLDQLKKAYYAQAQLWHPDRFGDPEERLAAGHEFQKLQDAYTFLKTSLAERRKSQETFLTLKHSFEVAKDSRNSEGGFTEAELDSSNQLGLLFNVFGMDCSMFSLLISLLNCMYEEDMADVYEPIWDFPEHYEGDPEEKKGWHITWQDSLRKVCLNRDPKRRSTFWVDRSKEFLGAMKEAAKGSAPFLADLLALEVATFDLYWPLPENPTQSFQWFTIENEFQKRFFGRVFGPLGLSGEHVASLRAGVLSAAQRLYPDWSTIHRGVFPRGDGTLLGAALSEKRDLVLTPDGKRSRNPGPEPEGAALAGAGMRFWHESEPRLLVIGGGGALLAPVCGEGTIHTGLWSLGEMLVSVAKLEMFVRNVVRPDKTFGFCCTHVISLLKNLCGHLSQVRSEAEDGKKERIGLARSWVEQVIVQLETT